MEKTCYDCGETKDIEKFAKSTKETYKNLSDIYIKSINTIIEVS